jgi:predicted nucleic acid-binding protein
MEAIIDDLAGRRCAALLGIPVRGTLGIVLTAKQRGVIPAARPVLECLIQSGLYLSRRILDTGLQRVGE